MNTNGQYIDLTRFHGAIRRSGNNFVTKARIYYDSFMELFSVVDRQLIEATAYDVSASPGYEMVRGCLEWEDERPRGAFD
jgi:hypothetical protein